MASGSQWSDTGDDLFRMYLDEERAASKKAAPRPVQAPRRAPTGTARPHQSVRVAQAKASTFGSALQFVDDNVRLLANGLTYGYADKWAAKADAVFTGRKQREAQLEQRQRTAVARRGSGVAVPYLGDVAPAEVIGGIVSPVNKIGMGIKTVRGAAALGAGDAFLAGMGYSDEETWSGTIEDGVRMAPWGALGGFVIGGTIKAAPKAIKLVRRKPAPSVEPAPAPKPNSTEPAPVKPKAEPEPTVTKVEPEEGALATPDQLKVSPEDAVRSAQAKIAAMTDEQAEAWAARVEAAENSGELLDDPHYRSILEVDISDVDVAPQKLIAAVNAAEEIHEAVLDRVAARKVTTSEVDADVTTAFAAGIGDEELTGLVTRADQGIRDARTATVLMTRAGVAAVNALERYGKDITEQSADALQSFKDNLGRALYVYAHGSAVRSKQGRALQIGQERNGLMQDTADNLWELDETRIADQLEESFGQLGPEGVQNLVRRLKSGDDLADVFDVLNRPERARAVSGFQRLGGSFEAFLKSNALTPITAVTNGIGAVLHDTFRNGLGRRWAAAQLARNGQEIEALGLRLELEAANEVYAKAHLLGIKSMLDRIKFDLWDSIESIAGVGFGTGKVRAMASASKLALEAKGTFSTEIREMSSQNPEQRLRVNDIDGFNQRMDELASQGGFGRLWSAAQRSGAVALNTLDAAGTLSGKLFTGAVDEWGKGFASFKEKYALAARSAVREAIDSGVDAADIPEFVRARTVQKAELPDEEMWEQAEEAMLRGNDPDPEVRDWLARKAAVENEALKVTVMDGPQTGFGKASAELLGKLDRFGIVMPYIRTPIRLLERGLIDYTPFGQMAEEGRKIIAAGGPEAAMFKAQMEIGTTVSVLGLGMGASGLMVVTNGDWGSAKNLEGEPSLRLQVGKLHIELGRLDPFVTTLALGAMWGQAGKDGFTDYEQYHDFEQAKQAGMSTLAFGFKDAVLSKSYLKGLKDLIDSVFDGSESKVEKLEASVASRLMPLGGSQKLVNDTIRTNTPEVISVSDGLYRSIVGLGLGLPTKRNALGDPIEGRDLGVSVGLSGDGVDDVGARLKELGINLSDVKKTDPKGFRRTAQQLDRLRELRGTVALDSEGRTMREALRDLLASEEFALMESKAAQEDMVGEVIRDFNTPAIDLLSEEDGTYAMKRDAHVTFEEYLAQGDALSVARYRAEDEVSDRYGDEFSFDD